MGVSLLRNWQSINILTSVATDSEKDFVPPLLCKPHVFIEAREQTTKLSDVLIYVPAEPQNK